MASLASVWANEVRLERAAFPTASFPHPSKNIPTAMTATAAVVRMVFLCMAFSWLLPLGLSEDAAVGIRFARNDFGVR